MCVGGSVLAKAENDSGDINILPMRALKSAIPARSRQPNPGFPGGLRLLTLPECAKIEMRPGRGLGQRGPRALA
jgi:hypothetical protein